MVCSRVSRRRLASSSGGSLDLSKARVWSTTSKVRRAKWSCGFVGWNLFMSCMLWWTPAVVHQNRWATVGNSHNLCRICGLQGLHLLALKLPNDRGESIPSRSRLVRERNCADGPRSGLRSATTVNSSLTLFSRFWGKGPRVRARLAAIARPQPCHQPGCSQHRC